MEIELNIDPIAEWGLKTEHPVIIAGPCSVESEEQVLTTARLIAQNEMVSIFRAGIWKPRTRPNSFEGVGALGLKWLKKVKSETGLLLAVEVANAQHCETALKHGIDILWLGARTTVNPFSVQEIADTLKGSDIPVMVKNPVNPGLDLWIGALERLNQAGITKLIAIHRGFSSYSKTIYRNEPDWELPIELKRRIPELPVICDPSHIGGKRELIPALAQQAFDLEMNGIMVEVHYQPESALSDAQQQITPDELNYLIKKLILRNPEFKNGKNGNYLKDLRKKIDVVDKELIRLFSARKNYVEKIAEFKKEKGITILQLNRWDEIMKTRIDLGEKMNLKKEFVQAIYHHIHEDSIKLQTEILNV
ncbi:MAG: bifunctional 3-deoxy-7-phosphoheptulonate synthase/chorismate mutase type II [Bacteroidia bacterium]|nr:bifunctional 3-deoxy-7-phosphoheptulonate synthase/chorismate mutase type II [Bacteroidia bacterium]